MQNARLTFEHFCEIHFDESEKQLPKNKHIGWLNNWYHNNDSGQRNSVRIKNPKQKYWFFFVSG